MQTIVETLLDIMEPSLGTSPVRSLLCQMLRCLFTLAAILSIITVLRFIIDSLQELAQHIAGAFCGLCG